MKLIMKGIEIPRKARALQVLGERVHRLIMNGVVVWSVRKQVRNYRADGSFVVPGGVTKVSICGCGGGGGGASSNIEGGSAGSIISNVEVAVTPGETIAVTIGSAGPVDNSGGSSSFGGLTMLGGSPRDYQGDGAMRSTCGGVKYDGLKIANDFGGEASPFSNGGDAGSPGEEGSGGGAGAMGGSGRIMVTWLQG